MLHAIIMGSTDADISYPAGVASVSTDIINYNRTINNEQNEENKKTIS